MCGILEAWVVFIIRYLPLNYWTISFSTHLWSSIRRSLTVIETSPCHARPTLWLAPSTIPGRSNSWIRAPLYSITPGIACYELTIELLTYEMNSMITVRVVNSYAAVSETVWVVLLSNVDLVANNCRDTSGSIWASTYLSYWRKPYQSNSGIPRFLYIESGTHWSWLWSWFEKLGTVSRKLSFQKPKVIFCCLYCLVA